MVYQLTQFEYWMDSKGEISSIKMTRINALREPLEKCLSKKFLNEQEIRNITTNIVHNFQFLEFLTKFYSEKILTEALANQFKRSYVILGMSAVEALLYLGIKK